MKISNEVKKRIVAAAAACVMLTGTAYLPEASVVMASGGITEVSSVQTEQTILITAQPDDISAKPGQKVTFRVSASGRDLNINGISKKPTPPHGANGEGTTHQGHQRPQTLHGTECL